METQTETTGGNWTRERIELVKRTVCPPGLTDDEFALFIEQCKRSGLDPLLKEAFCVPRRTNIGDKQRPHWVTRHEFQPSETGMLARAERFPDYRGVQASAVFAEDEIFIDAGKGEVSHRFNPTKRKGPIVGAWARVERRDKVPVVVWVDFAGYAQATPLWAKIPTTMIEKVSRVAALRKAYPEAFGGLYVREEMPAEEFLEETQARPALPAQTAPRVDLRAARPQSEEAEVVSSGTVRAPSQAVARETVPPGYESTAQRVAKAVGGTVVEAGPVVKYGDHKGRALASLTDAELSETLDAGNACLTVGKTPDGRALSPKAKHALQDAVLEVEAEIDRRMGPARQPGED